MHRIVPSLIACTIATGVMFLGIGLTKKTASETVIVRSLPMSPTEVAREINPLSPAPTSAVVDISAENTRLIGLLLYHGPATVEGSGVLLEDVRSIVLREGENVQSPWLALMRSISGQGDSPGRAGSAPTVSVFGNLRCATWTIDSGATVDLLLPDDPSLTLSENGCRYQDYVDAGVEVLPPMSPTAVTAERAVSGANAMIDGGSR